MRPFSLREKLSIEKPEKFQRFQCRVYSLNPMTRVTRYLPKKPSSLSNSYFSVNGDLILLMRAISPGLLSSWKIEARFVPGFCLSLDEPGCTPFTVPAWGGPEDAKMASLIAFSLNITDGATNEYPWGMGVDQRGKRGSEREAWIREGSVDRRGKRRKSSEVECMTNLV